MRIRAAVVILLLSASVFGSRAQAQGPATKAYCFLDATTTPLQANQTGWTWALACAMSDGQGHRDVLSGITIATLDGDNLAVTGQKIANGVKTFGALYGYNVTVVLAPSTTFIIPQ